MNTYIVSSAFISRPNFLQESDAAFGVVFVVIITQNFATLIPFLAIMTWQALRLETGTRYEEYMRIYRIY
jgi:predicted RNA binding protein with dsRBD fold (UPF0201 family)